MPTWYIPHGGGPCFFMEYSPPDTWDRMADYLKSQAATLPAKPRGIVMVSAHWLESDVGVMNGVRPELLFDYYGFPPHTYELTYPAPGSPELAARVQTLLAQAGQASHPNPNRGFDHGMFIPMMLMFPAADIPVVQVSLLKSLDPAAHLQLGRSLASLRDEGILIIGSGMSFHNMRGYRDPRFGPISDAFDDWLTQAMASPVPERNQALIDWAQAPMARWCHPPRAEEHLLPLMVVAGAAGQDLGRKVFTDRVLETRVSGFNFG